MSTRVKAYQIADASGLQTLQERLQEIKHIGAPVADTVSLPTTGIENERRFVGSEKKEYVFNKSLGKWEAIGGTTDEKVAAHTMSYTYTADGKIASETVKDGAGVITKKSDFAYFAAGTTNEGKISTETVAKNGQTITKSYSYDSITGKITGVSVSVA